MKQLIWRSCEILNFGWIPFRMHNLVKHVILGSAKVWKEFKVIHCVRISGSFLN